MIGVLALKILLYPAFGLGAVWALRDVPEPTWNKEMAACRYVPIQRTFDTSFSASIQRTPNCSYITYCSLPSFMDPRMYARWPPTHTVLRSPKSPVSKKAQWDIVDSKLESLSLVAPLPPAPPFLQSIEVSVLLIRLLKLRSEVELLRSEAESSSLRRSSSGIKFPEYDIGTPSQSISSSPTLISSTSLNYKHTEGGNSRTMLTKLKIPHSYDTNEVIEKSSSDMLSPLSPTFGPRKGVVLSGTVERRRSMPCNLLTNQNKSESDVHISRLHRSGHPANEIRDTEQRILWEAAWIEIEKNLDVYVDKFTQARPQNSVINTVEEVWTEIVILMDEKRELNNKLWSST